MSYWLPAAILAYMPSIESKLDSMILTPYSSWNPLRTFGAEVVGPVEVDEVAVDLGLRRRRERGVGGDVVADVGAAGQRQRRAQRQAARQEAPPRGPEAASRGCGVTPRPRPRRVPAAGADRRGRPGCRRWWRWRRAPRSSPRLGSLARTRAPSPSVSATAVSARALRVERGVEDPGGDALADDVGHGGVEVLVELGADLGEVRVADAQQGELLPEQPLVRALLVAGQAAVEERRQPLGGTVAGAGHGPLVELGGDAVRVASAPRRRAAPWCRSGSAAARPRPPRRGRSRPSGPGPGRRGRCSRRPRRGSWCAPPRRPARAGWACCATRAALPAIRPPRCLTVQSVSDARVAPVRRQGPSAAAVAGSPPRPGRARRPVLAPHGRRRRRQRRLREVGSHPRPARPRVAGRPHRAARQPARRRGARAARPTRPPRRRPPRTSGAVDLAVLCVPAARLRGLGDRRRRGRRPGDRGDHRGALRGGSRGRPAGGRGARDRARRRRRAGRPQLPGDRRHHDRAPAGPRRPPRRRRGRAEPERQPGPRPRRAAGRPRAGRLAVRLARQPGGPRGRRLHARVRRPRGDPGRRRLHRGRRRRPGASSTPPGRCATRASRWSCWLPAAPRRRCAARPPTPAR